MFRWFLQRAVCFALVGICSGAGAETVEVDLNIGLHGGYRVDELDWNTAGNADGTNPNIISELTWRDLKIYQVGVTAEISAGRPSDILFAYGRAVADYGWITEGENRDSDFSGDNRTLEWSRSISDAGDGEVYDLSVAGGPGLRMLRGDLTVIPLVGFSYHRQNLTMRDGFQVLSSPAAAPAGTVLLPVGPIAGLDSTYEAQWRGPWAGFDLCWSPFKRVRFSGGLEYHWIDYEADARWNLRSDLAQPVSFSHDAEGKGAVLAFGVDFDFAVNWVAVFEARYQNWEVDGGRDRIFFANNSSSVTRLNEVNWASKAWIIGVSRRFY